LATAEKVFQALADGTRRAMLERLSRGPATVTALAEPLGVTVAAVVQHLQVLEEGGLVETEKVGRTRTCRIRTSGFAPAERWMAARRSLWERRFDRLGEMLAEED
jgi:DNA-binding transcriptional ArsR family regulator